MLTGRRPGDEDRMNIKTFIIDSKTEYKDVTCRDKKINKYYELRDSGEHYFSIPDACIDLQFVKTGKDVIPYVCGTHLEGTDKLPGQNEWCFGVKFNPGIVPKLIRPEVVKLICSRKVIEDEPWITELREELGKTSSFEERVEIFREIFPYKEQVGDIDSRVEEALEKIKKKRGCINISDLAAELGYNQSYLDRLFYAATGMSMKKFSTIVRMQSAIRYLQEDKTDEVYEKLGYYDQSYFIREFRKYTGMTPRQWAKKSQKRIV